MLIHTKRLICLIIIGVVMAGCSTKAVMNNANKQKNSTQQSNGIFNTGPSDKEMFEEALSYLSNNEKEPNYNEAKARLENLIVQFPTGKWVAAAQALLSGLNSNSALQAQLKQEKQKVQDEHVKLMKEIEGLRGNAKQIEEKYSAEIIRLQQENEQLKKDIQQLRNLEIQLEKREKMLR